MTNNNIEERLDLLRERIQEDSFLEGKGLSNEVTFKYFAMMLSMR